MVPYLLIGKASRGCSYNRLSEIMLAHERDVIREPVDSYLPLPCCTKQDHCDLEKCQHSSSSALEGAQYIITKSVATLDISTIDLCSKTSSGRSRL